MKRTKGIGPNNLGVSKSAVKNQNKGYAGDFGSMATQTNPSNAELGGGGGNNASYKKYKEQKKKEQPDAPGNTPPKDPKQTMKGSVAPKSKNYGGSMANASKYGAMIKANMDKGMNPTEAGKQAAIDIKKEK